MALIKLTLKQVPRAAHTTATVPHRAETPARHGRARDVPDVRERAPEPEPDAKAREVYLSADAVVTLEAIDAGGCRVTAIGGNTYDACEAVEELAALVGVAKRQRG